MNIEQINKLYSLLSGIVVASYLSLIVLILIGALIFGYVYTKKVYLDDLKHENKRKEEILKKLDKGYLVDSSYISYISDLKERIKSLEDELTLIYSKKKK